MPSPTPEQLKELSDITNGMPTPEGYTRLVEYCATNNITLPLSNGHWKHAATLLKWFFRIGKDRVFILTGKLHEKVFDDPETIKYTSEFIRGGGKVSIAFTEAVSHNLILSRPFVKDSMDAALETDPSGKKNLFVLKDASSIAPHASHFMVVDGRGFRFETDHSRSIATANFDNSEIAKRLEIVFKEIFEKCINVSPELLSVKENIA